MLDDAPKRKKIRMRKSFKPAKLKQRGGLLQFHPVEVARQLTLIEYDLFQAIDCSEFLGQVRGE